MKFVRRDSGSEVSLTHGVNRASLLMIPPNVEFSGAALVRVNGHRGSAILVTTVSQVVVYIKDSQVYWEGALDGLIAESLGVDQIRLKTGDKVIEIGTGLSSRKKLIAHLEYAASNPQILTATPEIVEINEPHVQLAKPVITDNSAVDRKMMRLEQKEERQRIKREEIRSNEESFGKLVIEAACAGKTVRIYSKGYIRISGLFGGNAPYEKLLAISASADVSKKTGLGRGVVAAATMGANLLYTSNKRGDLYLAISTDHDTHMLHMSPPTERDMKAMHKLATAGQAVIDATKAAQHDVGDHLSEVASRNEKSTLADELAKLVDLRDSGALTDEEFQIAKKKIL